MLELKALIQCLYYTVLFVYVSSDAYIIVEFIVIMYELTPVFVKLFFFVITVSLLDFYIDLFCIQ